jgi:sulfhydrogenase subunit beta (sulfur reductase)
MQILKMNSDHLTEFLESLRDFGSLYGPTRKDGLLVFDRIDDIRSLEITDENTLLPLKKLFHPRTFDMFRFDENGFTPDYSLFEKRVVIGVHPCEIHGIRRLDEVFMGNQPDPYYAGLRNNTAVIGFSCLPTENSLCKSTGTDIVESGFDLFFVNLGDFHLVWVGSSLGHDMILKREQFFSDNVTHEEIQEYIAWRRRRDSMFKKSFDFDSMPDIMDLSYNSDVWEFFASKCLSCGQCTMVCPTCNCYDVRDVLDISPTKTGRRERYWDSCMFADYSQVAGGHNFRGNRSSRLKLWYNHKLKAYPHEFGRPSCVGCGRCVETCPVDINVLTVSDALTKCEVPKE